MSVETINHLSSRQALTFMELPMTEPAEVRRSPEEKARILARLTLALAATDQTEGRTHGNA